MLLENLLVSNSHVPPETYSRTVLWESLLREDVAQFVREDKTCTVSFIKYLPLNIYAK